MTAALIVAVALLSGADAVLAAVVVTLCRSQNALTKVLSDDYRREVEPKGEARPRVVGMYRNKQEDDA